MRGKAASASSLAGAARAFGRHYVRYSFGLSYLVFWCSSYRWVGLLKGLVIDAVRRFAIAWVSGGDGFSSGLYMMMIHWNVLMGIVSELYLVIRFFVRFKSLKVLLGTRLGLETNAGMRKKVNVCAEICLWWKKQSFSLTSTVIKVLVWSHITSI